MNYRLSIANKVGVRVKGATQDESGAQAPFEFVVVMNRRTGDEIAAEIDDRSRSVRDFVRENAVGWRDQQLVLAADGRPAAFGAEALEVLLSIAGMAAHIWKAYLEQAVVAEKN